MKLWPTRLQWDDNSELCLAKNLKCDAAPFAVPPITSDPRWVNRTFFFKNGAKDLLGKQQNKFKLKYPVNRKLLLHLYILDGFD